MPSSLASNFMVKPPAALFQGGFRSGMLNGSQRFARTSIAMSAVKGNTTMDIDEST